MLQQRRRNLPKPRTENGIGKVRPRLVEIGNAVKLGRPAHTETLQLRKDIPDPMALLLARRNFGEGLLVVALLRFMKRLARLYHYFPDQLNTGTRYYDKLRRVIGDYEWYDTRALIFQSAF